MINQFLFAMHCFKRFGGYDQRLNASGLAHHVMIRGIERRNVLAGGKDRDNLNEHLTFLLPETKMARCTWP